MMSSMRRFILYGNGNSENHGCEALTRSICKLLQNSSAIEFVNDTTTDSQYGIQQVIQRREWEHTLKYSHFVSFLYKVAYRFRMHDLYNRIRYNSLLKELSPDDVAISIGGDNYCYSDIIWLQSLNRLITKKSKTVLLGVSIEPSLLTKKSMLVDLSRYSLIIARESITSNALEQAGLKDHTILLPDPAFALESETTKLPASFIFGNTVGINISPMVIGHETNNGIAYQNFENLIRHILDTTDMNVALIPHVVWAENDDRIPLQSLYDTFQSSGRICLIQDQNCMRLKHVISQCRFFVGARTHATIAAYSSFVPTLVVGYSVKAKGIAKDLFGTFENYVIPVQDFSAPDDLMNAFSWIQQNESKIKSHLISFIPEYRQRVYEIPKIISQISNR